MHANLRSNFYPSAVVQKLAMYRKIFVKMEDRASKQENFRMIYIIFELFLFILSSMFDIASLGLPSDLIDLRFACTTA